MRCFVHVEDVLLGWGEINKYQKNNMETVERFFLLPPSRLVRVCVVQNTASKHAICWVVVGLNLSPVCGLHCSFIGLCAVNLPLTLIPRPPPAAAPWARPAHCWDRRDRTTAAGQQGGGGGRYTPSLSVPEQLIILVVGRKNSKDLKPYGCELHTYYIKLFLLYFNRSGDSG